MTYGAKAVIPVETRLPTSRTNMFEVEKNDQLLCKHLDLVEENHNVASIKLANYQQRINRGTTRVSRIESLFQGTWFTEKFWEIPEILL